MKAAIEFLVAAPLILFALLVRLLPIDVASAIGGKLMRCVGRYLKETKLALSNLAMVFPEKSHEERYAIMLDMWEHLGRVAFEYPFLGSQRLERRVTIVNGELAKGLAAKGQPVMFVSGHLGNWELLALSCKYLGIPVNAVYRRINNRFLNRYVRHLRASFYTGLIEKDPATALKVFRVFKDEQSLAMLVDQKIWRGLQVPFLGHHATTLQLPAEIALRFKLPIVTFRSKRLKGVRYEIIVSEPFYPEDTGDKEADVYRTMQRINDQLSEWIRETPEQWFWVHDRWKVYHGPKIKTKKANPVAVFLKTIFAKTPPQ